MAVNRTHIRVSDRAAKLLKKIAEKREETQVAVFDEIIKEAAKKEKVEA